jgi:Uma2 family endonuclease
MGRLKSAIPDAVTFEDVWERVGRVPLHRIRMNPPPGYATEQDVIRIQDREDISCELIDGVLVEKVMGVPESALAFHLGHSLGSFVKDNDRGFITAPDGTFRLMPGLVRIPDLAFVSWEQLPKKFYPTEPVPDLAPRLAIEVLSKGNTKAEMELKLRDYFVSGVQLVWFIDPDKRTVRIYTAPDEFRELSEQDSLDGGDVLPGFSLPLAELFRYVEPKVGPKKKGTNGGRKQNGR